MEQSLKGRTATVIGGESAIVAAISLGLIADITVLVILINCALLAERVKF